MSALNNLLEHILASNYIKKPIRQIFLNYKLKEHICCSVLYGNHQLHVVIYI